MENNQNQQESQSQPQLQPQEPALNSQPSSQQQAQPLQTVNPNAAAASAQTAKPTLNVGDAEAQAILLINNLKTANNQPKRNMHLTMIIAITSLIILAVAASMLLSAFKPGASSGSLPGGAGLPSQSSDSSSGDVTNQVNQDAKSCTNPVNALTVC